MVELSLLKSLLTGAPYYGPALRADADADGREAFLAVVNTLRSLKSSPRILELGSWLGAATAQLTASLDSLFSDWSLVCVEDFHSPLECATSHPVNEDGLIEFYDKAAKDGVLAGLLQHNLKYNEQRSRLRLVNAPFEDALQEYADGSFDLVVLHGARALSQFCGVLDQCERVCADDGIVCGSGLLLQADEADAGGLNYCLRFPNRAFTAYDERTKKRYYPEITAEVSKRYGRVAAYRGFWAVQFTPGQPPRSIEMPSSPEARPLPDADDQYAVLRLADGRYAALHDSIPVSLLFNERLGEREIPELLELCATKEEAQAAASRLNERRRRRKGVWLDTTEFYYLVKFGENTYMAQSKFLKPPNGLHVFRRELGEDELEPLLLLAPSLEELRRNVARNEAAMRSAKQPPPILERYQGYYLYEASQDYWVAVRIDLKRGRPFHAYLGEEDLDPYVLTADSLDTLRDRIGQRACALKGDSRSDETERWL